MRVVNTHIGEETFLSCTIKKWLRSSDEDREKLKKENFFLRKGCLYTEFRGHVDEHCREVIASCDPFSVDYELIEKACENHTGTLGLATLDKLVKRVIQLKEEKDNEECEQEQEVLKKKEWEPDRLRDDIDILEINRKFANRG